jgi:hypothetical protein
VSDEDSESSDNEPSIPGLIYRTQEDSSDEDDSNSEEKNVNWNSDDEDQIQEFQRIRSSS